MVILFAYFENLFHKSIYFYLNYLINIQIISLEPFKIFFGGFLFFFFIFFLIIVIDKFFEIFYKTKINIILYTFYLIFQIIFLVIIIFSILSNYLIFKDIYLYLKNLINIKLISIESEYIMFYTSTIFFFLISTIIFIPIILIYSYKDKKGLFINTKYNMLIIIALIIFGIIGIIYSLLLNNLGYVNIIYLTDIYLIVIYLSISLLVLMITLIKIDFYYVPFSVKFKASKIFSIKYFIKNIKEKNINRMIRSRIAGPLLVFSIIPYGQLSLYIYSQGLIPWYSIIFSIFYLYIFFEIIIKKSFLNKETFYQDLYKLNKYINKRLLIIFGILAFIAIFDILNFLLLRNYTIQNVIQPIVVLEELFSKTYQDLLFRVSIISSLAYLFCFLFYYMFFYYVIYPIRYYFLHYYSYILAENLGYKIDNDEIKIKNIQISPMITFLSYSALFIVFIINLML
jgi:hypothetical protein